MTATQTMLRAQSPTSPYPKETLLSELCAAELLLLWSLRMFVAAHLDGQSNDNWRDGLMASGVGCCAVPAFDTLFGIVATSAQRRIDVRCRHSQTLSGDEARFLQLICLLQHGHIFDARDVLSDWLPRAAVRAAILPAKALAFALARRRLFVPQRSFPEYGAISHVSALVH